jgi:hypothetical protein
MLGELFTGFNKNGEFGMHNGQVRNKERNKRKKRKKSKKKDRQTDGKRAEMDRCTDQQTDK